MSTAIDNFMNKLHDNLELPENRAKSLKKKPLVQDVGQLK